MWLDRFVSRLRIPYPVSFGLMALFLYLLGFPFMLATGNLQSFLSEPRWVLIALFGALNGILVVFVFRKFSNALDGIQYLIDAGGNFTEIKRKLLGHLTRRIYWVIVVFWLVLNFVESPSSMRWWWFYNQPGVITVYELIETLPCCVLGGIFMYMIPIGLNLAYRDLCLHTPFKKGEIRSEWLKPFKNFRWLITLTMFGAVVYALFPPNIWGTSPEPAAAAHWVVFIPYTGIAIVLISAILLPHYFFHRLFSKTKKGLLGDIEVMNSQATTHDDKTVLNRILFLLEKGEVEKLKTWLLDVKTVGEIAAVVLIHVALVEALSMLMHR